MIWGYPYIEKPLSMDKLSLDNYYSLLRSQAFCAINLTSGKPVLLQHRQNKEPGNDFNGFKQPVSHKLR